MNILQINLQDGWRGGEQQLSYLILDLQKKDIRQTLVCKKHSPLEKFAKENNIDYISLELGLFSFIPNVKKFSEWVKKNNVDILHCNESKGLGIAVWSKILFKIKAKLLLHRHVIFPVKGFISKNIKYSPKYIDKVICVSSQGEKVIRTTTYNTNISVIPTMTDVRFDYKNEGILEQFGIDLSKKIIGYIAALTFEKDHYTFLQAAEKICKNHNNIHFIIVGSGKLETKLKEYADSLDLTENVSFLGFVPQANRLIPEIDIMLFTSTQEGFPTTIIDSFIAKKPVVCTNYPGSSDIIIPDVTGFLCEIKNIDCLAAKTIALIQNPDLSEKITQEAYQVAIANFSIESVSDKIYAMYREIIKDSKS